MQCAGKDVGALIRDGNRAVGNLNSIRITGSAVPLEGDLCAGFLVILNFQIVIRKHI